MLKSLSIVNYALIEKLEINFDSGFSVITGETGAGKSIILGALSLILGSRADLSLLKNKDRKCVIEGVFNNGSLNIEDFFKESDLDFDSQTIIRRELLPGGKSRAFINDTPVNLKLINYLGNILVNIHSQHQTLKIADASFQLAVLDDFAVKPSLILDYQKEYATYLLLQSRLEELVSINERSARDEDYFKFQYDELEKVNLDSDSFDELEERAKLLEHSEEIKIALTEAEHLITESDESLLLNHSRLIKTINSIAEYLPKAGELSERLNSLLIELEDIGGEVNNLNSNEEFEPLELENINERLNQVYSLYKKHHVSTVEDLIELRNEFEERLLNIHNVENDILAVKNELSASKDILVNKAEKLHNQRVKGSDNFASAVKNTLSQLGMKDAVFNVFIEKLTAFNKHGADKVQFMFNANLGSEPGEISKIASGGELSRLMLAIKSLINQQQMLPTVIFDEIDSGVSGDIAGKVGKILKKMSETHQVISISHLPQIASKADHHYKVFKTISNNSTITTIDNLDQKGRIDELAAMLSSEKVTETAINVAKEMIEE